MRSRYSAYVKNNWRCAALLACCSSGPAGRALLWAMATCLARCMTGLGSCGTTPLNTLLNSDCTL